MKYYSTNHKAPLASLQQTVEQGLAPDRGLYMPERLNLLPNTFFEHIEEMSFQELSFEVARALFGEDVNHNDLRRIVYDTLNFETPVVKVRDNIHALELFHGPTLAFKDVGARFMARLLQYFIRKDQTETASAPHRVNVLVATSGDTGSAVANGFLGVDGIHVYVLYPKGKVSHIQESQFTTLGQNITALEVDGVFDDCQALVKSAFMDDELKRHMTLTSANSINVARFLPQAFYYFNAFAQLKREGILNIAANSEGQLVSNLVFCVPSGNFGNVTAGLFAAHMGLPVKHFIAANNANSVFYNYLRTGLYKPQASKQTIANAMDVGAPSNFARIIDLYDNQWAKIKNDIGGATYTDDHIRCTMKTCYDTTNYVLDPHGACGYQALCEQLQPDETGVFLETAHPAKFKETVDSIDGIDITIPPRLRQFMEGKKQSIPMTRRFDDFKQFLLQQ